MSMLAAGVLGQQGSFDPYTSLPWTCFMDADGPLMQAQGYTNLAAVTFWPDEVGNQDATNVTQPTFYTAPAETGGRPAVRFANSRLDQASVSALNHYTVFIVGYLYSGTNRWLDDQVNGVRVIPMLGYISNWQLFAAGGAQQSVPMSTGFYATRSRLGSAITGSHSGHANGAAIYTNVNVGSGNWVGQRMGSSSGQGYCCIMAVYPGDLTADPAWPAFQGYISDRFGLAA